MAGPESNDVSSQSCSKQSRPCREKNIDDLLAYLPTPPELNTDIACEPAQGLSGEIERDLDEKKKKTFEMLRQVRGKKKITYK